MRGKKTPVRTPRFPKGEWSFLVENWKGKWSLVLKKPEDPDSEWMNMKLVATDDRKRKANFQLSWNRKEMRFADNHDFQILCGQKEYGELSKFIIRKIQTTKWSDELSKM